MRIRLTIWLMAMACLLAGCGKPNPAHVQAEKDATDAALAWLALIDQEKYAESWEQSAVPFKKGITAESWAATVKSVRGPMGKLESRELSNRDFMTELPGAPKGEYVIIQFKSRFKNKKNAVETITPMLEDGKWKVSGYFIK